VTSAVAAGDPPSDRGLLHGRLLVMGRRRLLFLGKSIEESDVESGNVWNGKAKLPVKIFLKMIFWIPKSLEMIGLIQVNFKYRYINYFQ
jgi:hypothetical protein